MTAVNKFSVEQPLPMLEIRNLIVDVDGSISHPKESSDEYLTYVGKFHPCIIPYSISSAPELPEWAATLGGPWFYSAPHFIITPEDGDTDTRGGSSWSISGSAEEDPLFDPDAPYVAGLVTFQTLAKLFWMFEGLSIETPAYEIKFVTGFSGTPPVATYGTWNASAETLELKFKFSNGDRDDDGNLIYRVVKPVDQFNNVGRLLTLKDDLYFFDVVGSYEDDVDINGYKYIYGFGTLWQAFRVFDTSGNLLGYFPSFTLVSAGSGGGSSTPFISMEVGTDGSIYDEGNLIQAQFSLYGLPAPWNYGDVTLPATPPDSGTYARYKYSAYSLDVDGENLEMFKYEFAYGDDLQTAPTVTANFYTMD